VDRQPPERRSWVDEPGAVEVALPKGDVTEGVVRVGATVRRPHTPASYAIAHLLDHLADAGVAESCRYLGRDAQGRDVLTYVEGDVAGASPESWATGESLLGSVARLVRRLHVASAGFDADRTLFPGPGLVCHFDVTPQNVVVSAEEAVGLVDFDLARRGDPVEDAYNTAMHWVPLRDPADVYPHWTGVDQPRRLRVFADAYGLDRASRLGLVTLGTASAQASWHRMRTRAETLGGGWARMWTDGVGDLIRRRERWLREHREELTAALLDRGAAV
jgi:hypothetical protein